MASALDRALHYKKLHRPTTRVSQGHAAQLELVRSTLPGTTGTALSTPTNRGTLPVSLTEAVRSLSRPPSRAGAPVTIVGGSFAPTRAQRARPASSHLAMRERSRSAAASAAVEEARAAAELHAWPRGEPGAREGGLKAAESAAIGMVLATGVASVRPSSSHAAFRVRSASAAALPSGAAHAPSAGAAQAGAGAGAGAGVGGALHGLAAEPTAPAPHAGGARAPFEMPPVGAPTPSAASARGARTWPPSATPHEPPRPPRTADGAGARRPLSATGLPGRAPASWAAEMCRLRPEREVGDEALALLWARRARQDPAPRVEALGARAARPDSTGRPDSTATPFGVRLGSALSSTLARPLADNPAVRLQWALGAAVDAARRSADPAAEAAAWDEAMGAAADALRATSHEWAELIAGCQKHYAQQLRETVAHAAQLEAALGEADAALRSVGASARGAPVGWLGGSGGAAGGAAARADAALGAELESMRRSMAKLEASSLANMTMAQRVAALRQTLSEVGGSELAHIAAEMLKRCDAPGRHSAAAALDADDQLDLVEALARGWDDERANCAAARLYELRDADGRASQLRHVARHALQPAERAACARECVRALDGSARTRLLLELVEREASDADKRELLPELLRGPAVAPLGRGARRELLGHVLDAMAADEAASALSLELRGRLDGPQLLAAAGALLCAPPSSPTPGGAQRMESGRARPHAASFAALLVDTCALPTAAVAQVSALALLGVSGTSMQRLHASLARTAHALTEQLHLLATDGADERAAAAGPGSPTSGGSAARAERRAARRHEETARLLLGALTRGPSGDAMPPPAPAQSAAPPPQHRTGGADANGAAARAEQPREPRAQSAAPPPPPAPPADGAAALLRAAASMGSLADVQPAVLVAALFATLDGAGRAQALGAMAADSAATWGDAEIDALAAAAPLATRLAARLAPPPAAAPPEPTPPGLTSLEPELVQQASSEQPQRTSRRQRTSKAGSGRLDGGGRRPRASLERSDSIFSTRSSTAG
ncbi:hypothetical protein KFE25_000323 [Diacronema lutheri]|uniref:Uncharacterized protein n=1 Tax=Diacronema lutheri TaxID=2081491 RepID=A0A8J5XPR0_DIALT|nr:hypothetical protein KFE25_000323 [Diacronema lutheri]